MTSLQEITEVAKRLGPLRERVVFLGGAVTGLLITDPAAPEVRPTDDVDVIIQVASWAAYSRVEEELRGLGFHPRHEEGDPICRWSVAGIAVDVMPTDETILGFGNQWYVPALESADTVALPGGLDIQLISSPYFLATKLEAFRSRGRGDVLLSTDIADIVSLVDGRTALVAEVAAASPPVKEFIAAELRENLTSEMFLEAVAGHMRPDTISQQRVPLILDRMRQLASIA